MASVSFVLKKGESPATIYARVTGGYIEGETTSTGKRKKLDVIAPTKYKIDPKDWNDAKQRLRNPRNSDNRELNNDLDELERDIRKYYEKSTGNTPITSKWLKSFLLPSVATAEFSGKLTDLIDMYVAEKREARARAAKESKEELNNSYDKKLTTVKNKILAFEKWNKGTLYVKYIDSKTIKDFERYSNECGYSHNTIARDILHIKTLCTYARKKGYDTNAEIEGITSGFTDTNAVYLTPDELNAIRELKGLSERLERTRDWLIISCHTGQRASDFLRFDMGMVQHEKGQPFIHFRQTKTRKPMAIPLHPEVVAIIERNGGNFPKKISSQNYNEALKDLCEVAEINDPVQGSKMIEIGKDKNGDKIFRKVPGTFKKWELITSHTGRRSFATNYYGKMPVELIMSITGHASKDEFLKYIRLGNSDLTKEAAKYFV